MNRLGLSGLLFLGLFVSACMDTATADTWPDHRGNMRGVNNATVDVQTFTGGAGTYTYTVPAWARIINVFMCGPGGGGGSGGATTSDSGGGGGANGGGFIWKFDKTSLNSTESIILSAGGTGGTGVAAGDGAQGGNPGECSFGAAARNLMRVDPDVALSGGGGTNASGTAGTQIPPAMTTRIGFIQLFAFNTAGAGDDTAAGTSPTANSAISSASNPQDVTATANSGGGGGGGTNGGANFTNGGAGGDQRFQATTGADIPFRLGVAGGTTDGQAGTDGGDGGRLLATANGVAGLFCGQGGGGGAGAVVAARAGGKGGNGGNCGGGGGGGGSSLTGTSGAGGNGGACCIFVLAE